MPELPEVETVMRGLQARLEGRVIARAATHRLDLRWPIPAGFAQRLTGARVHLYSIMACLRISSRNFLASLSKRLL